MSTINSIKSDIIRVISGAADIYVAMWEDEVVREEARAVARAAARMGVRGAVAMLRRAHASEIPEALGRIVGVALEAKEAVKEIAKVSEEAGVRLAEAAQAFGNEIAAEFKEAAEEENEAVQHIVIPIAEAVEQRFERGAKGSHSQAA